MKDIPEYEGLYAIEEDGRIWGYKRKKYLKPYINKGGYYAISLCKNNIENHKLIHRLIGIAYIPNPDNKPCIDHINRDKKDNRLENLRWATTSENNRNISNHKDNKLQEKNIWYNKNKKTYKYTHTRDFKTLEEAIEYRDNYSGNKPC